MTKSELRDVWWGMAHEDPSRVKQARVQWDELVEAQRVDPDQVKARAEALGLDLVEWGRRLSDGEV